VENPTTSDKTKPERTYLGDGLYCDDEGYALKVFASNGIETTNTVWIEPDMLTALIAFARRRGYAV